MEAETKRRMTTVTHGPDVPLPGSETRFGTLEVEIAAVRIEPGRLRRAKPDEAQPVRVEIELVPGRPVRDPIVSVSLCRVADATMVLDVNTAGDSVLLGEVIDKPVTVVLILDRLDLESGAYRFDVGVYERDWGCVYDYHWQAYPFEIEGGAGSGFGPRRRWTIGQR